MEWGKRCHDAVNYSPRYQPTPNQSAQGAACARSHDWHAAARPPILLLLLHLLSTASSAHGHPPPLHSPHRSHRLHRSQPRLSRLGNGQGWLHGDAQGGEQPAAGIREDHAALVPSRMPASTPPSTPPVVPPSVVPPSHHLHHSPLSQHPLYRPHLTFPCAAESVFSCTAVSHADANMTAPLCSCLPPPSSSSSSSSSSSLLLSFSVWAGLGWVGLGSGLCRV